MTFEQNKLTEKLGKKIGYISAYFLFTTVLFFILTLLNKVPKSWSYLNVMAIVFLIALVGVVFKRLLK